MAFATKFFFLRTHKRQIMASQFPIYLSFSSLDSERGLIGRNNSFICSHRKGIFDTLLPPASWEHPLSSASFAAAGSVASSLPSVTTSYISLPCCNSLTAVLFSGCSLRACVPLQNPPFSHSTAFLESGSLQIPVKRNPEVSQAGFGQKVPGRLGHPLLTLESAQVIQMAPGREWECRDFCSFLLASLK